PALAYGFAPSHATRDEMRRYAYKSPAYSFNIIGLAVFSPLEGRKDSKAQRRPLAGIRFVMTWIGLTIAVRRAPSPGRACASRRSSANIAVRRVWWFREMGRLTAILMGDRGEASMHPGRAGC